MTKKLAFLGYGLRSKTMLQAFREIEADISVAAVADPRWEQIKEENAGDPLFAEARYFENADALLGGCEPDGVFIGTRCPLHTPLAVEVLKRDIPLFLEKPVCISEAQYRTLREAAEGKLDRAVCVLPSAAWRISPSAAAAWSKAARSGASPWCSRQQCALTAACTTQLVPRPEPDGGLFCRKRRMISTISATPPADAEARLCTHREALL